jgi:hypothetical protein
MKRLLLITAIVCLFGYIATGPFLTLQGIKNGIESADMESLSDNVDFPVLRQNLKDQLNAQLSSTLTEDSDDWGTKLASGFATLFTDKLVDNFVTPAGLSKLFSGEKINNGETPELSNMNNMFNNMSFALRSHNRFHALVEGDNNKTVVLSLKREGLTWKLTNIILPLD